MIDSHEVAKPHGQPLGLNRDFSSSRGRQRRHHHGSVAATLFLGQQGDEGRFQGSSGGLRAQGLRRTGRQHFARIHGHQPVEAVRLFHVGGSDNHAHVLALGPDMLDQVPELFTRERINAGGGFIQNQQVGIVDQRTAEAEFLFHAA